MLYDYLQQSDDTNKDERSQTPNCVLYNCTNMKYKSNTAARSQSDALPRKGKRSDWKEGQGDFWGIGDVLFFFFFLSTDCKGGLIVQIHTDKCTFLYAYFASEVF